MSEVNCPHCGGSNEQDAAFCGVCGTPLPAQGPYFPAGQPPPQAWQPPGVNPPPQGAYAPLPPGAIPAPQGAYPPGHPVYQQAGQEAGQGANFVGQLPIAHTEQVKKRLVSRNTWIVCSIISILMALSNASNNGATGLDVFIPYVLGGFIGGLLLLVGCCAGVTLIYRAISQKRLVA